MKLQRYTLKDSTPKKFSCQAGEKGAIKNPRGRECKPNQDINERYNNFFESIISSGTIKKLPFRETSHAEVTPKCCDMEGHAMKFVEKLSEAVIYRLHTMCRRPPVQKRRLVGNSGTIQKVCSHTVLKCPYSARIGRPDIVVTLLVKSDHQMEQSLW